MKLDLSQSRPCIDLADASLRLTQAQASACNILTEIMVTAGAGSGKTHTLSLRYVVLLLEIAAEAVRTNPHDPRPDIQRVLVLTFTERAAQEMAQRCYQRLLSLSTACRQQSDGLEAAYGPAMAKGLPLALARLLDRFDEARVSTFHGFCATIHREFPDACGTPADSRIAEADEAQRILRDTLSDVLRDFGTTHPQSLRVLMGAFSSRSQVLESAQAAIQNRGRLAEFLQESASGQRNAQTLVDQAYLSPEAASNWLMRQGLPLLQQLQRILAPAQGGPSFQTHILPVLESASRTTDEPLAIYAAYTSVLSSLLTDRGVLRSLGHHSIVGTKASWPSNDQRLEAIAALSEVAEQCSEWPDLYQNAQALPTPADLSMLEALEALSELVLLTMKRYDAELRARGLLDFDALQRRAIQAVLQHAPVAEALTSRHRYLMVDEFQDTDAAQWDLVQRLGRPQGKASDRLFLVGDAKQAIYGFRGGDVTVFQAAARELGIAPILFPENFRSRTELIDWFNPFFHSVLGPPSDSRPDWEAAHQELKPARAEALGSVRLLTHEEPSGPSAAAAEAIGIANFLRDSVFSSGGLLGPETLPGQGNTPEVAILLRARTHLHLFEEALRLADIPFQVGGGVGFWSRPEIVDLVNVLHALASGDEVSTVGALRSPLFALSDDDIQGLYGSRASHRSERFGIAPLPTSNGSTVEIAGRIWHRLQRDRHRLPWPTLLREVLKATHAAHALELSGGARARANVQRLLNLSDQLASHGVNQLDEAAALFLRNVQSGERESEATLSNDAARVVVLTIHASKGLEFPVVVLPGLDARPPVHTAPLLCQRIGGRMEMACRVEDPDAAVQTRVSPGSWHRLSAQSTLEETAERKRLLYVAATRARDHLVLAGGTSRVNSEGNTWMHALAAHHGPAFEGLKTEPLDPRLPPGLSGAPGLRLATPAPAPSSAPPSRTVRLSPSGMDRFLECPARWYRKTCMGIPEPSAPRSDFPRAATLGSVLHALLEHSLAEADPEALRLWRFEATRAGASSEEVAHGEPILLSHLEACRNSEELSDALAADGYNELGFSLKKGSLELSGVIDRLWKDETTQHWCILDYKSGRHLPQTPAQSVGEEHVTQLSAYAWAAEQVLRGQNAGDIGPLQVLLTSTGELHRVAVWTEAARLKFEALLDSISSCADSSWPEVLGQALNSTEKRPCGQCGYYQKGCAGQP